MQRIHRITCDFFFKAMGLLLFAFLSRVAICAPWGNSLHLMPESGALVSGNQPSQVMPPTIRSSNMPTKGLNRAFSKHHDDKRLQDDLDIKA
jgi:hypothetical protein